MNYREMLDKARQNMKPKCRVCPECNGIACRGELPGTGGYGNGRSFTVCREYLKSVKICMDTLCSETDPDLKQTPELVPYEQLNETTRSFIRRQVREIPGQLREIGYELYFKWK